MIIVASDCPSKHIQRQGGDDSTRMITWGTIIQWEFQDPKLEVPTIYKAYFWGLCKGISPENMARNMVLTYLRFRILEFPLKYGAFHKWGTLKQMVYFMENPNLR